MALPDSRARATVSQSRRRATGSMPVDGSSRKITTGSPRRAMPVLSFLLLPPLGAENQKRLQAGACSKDTKSPALTGFKGGGLRVGMCPSWAWPGLDLQQGRLQGTGFWTQHTCRSGPACQHEALGAGPAECSPRRL